MSTLLDPATTLLRSGWEKPNTGSLSIVGYSGKGPSTGANGPAPLPVAAQEGDLEISVAVVLESGLLARPTTTTTLTDLFPVRAPATACHVYGYYRFLDSTLQPLNWQGVDSLGNAVETYDHTVQTVVVRGVHADVLGAPTSSQTGQSKLHWGIGARDGSTLDRVDVPNCLHIVMFPNNGASRTFEWGPDLKQVVNRGGTAPQILTAIRWLPNVGVIGGQYLHANTASVGCMVSLVLKPATPVL
jgi:hypothetical protein